MELLVSLSVTRSSRSSSKAAEWRVGSGEVDWCMFDWEEGGGRVRRELRP